MITTQTTRINHTANGVATTYAYPFYILALEDLKVSLWNPATGETTPQTLHTHYEITGGVQVNTGGSVVFYAVPASGLVVQIRRQTPAVQPDSYIYNSQFPSKTIETSLDRQICIAQELADSIAQGGGSDNARGVLSFQNTSQLSAFNVSDGTKYPLGSVMLIFNSTLMMVENWVLLNGAPTGSQISANGRPGTHWQRA